MKDKIDPSEIVATFEKLLMDSDLQREVEVFVKISSQVDNVFVGCEMR